MPIRLKPCSGPCGRSKMHDEFWRDSKQPDGRMTRCIECVKADREERAQRRASGEVVPAVSEELRQQRSERAKRLNAEGRFGGAEFAKLAVHPSRRPRLADTLLDWAKENSHLAVKALEANLRSKQKSQRMRALEFMAGLEQSDDKTKAALRGAGKSPEEMSLEELEELVTQGLRAKIESGEIDISSVITLADDQVQEMDAAA